VPLGALDGGALPDGGGTDSGAADAGVQDAGIPDAGITDAGPADAGGDSGIATDGGTDAGPPYQLLFTTVAQSTTAGVCSSQVVVEIADSNGQPAPGGASVTVLATGLTGFALFTDPGCGTALSSPIVVPPGSTALTLFYQGTQSGTETVNVTAPGLIGDNQSESIIAGAASQLAFVSAAKLLPVDGCSKFGSNVRVEDAFGNVSIAVNGLSVTLTVTGPGSVETFTDNTCRTPAPAPTIAPGGSASTLFYFQGTAAGTPTVTASAPPLASAAQTQNVLSEVRRGNCVVPLTGTTFTCPINPAVTSPSQTFVISQAVVDSAAADDANIACDLDVGGALLDCQRSSGTSDPTTHIVWQAVERVDGGMTVVHLDNPTCTPAPGGFSVSFAPAVNSMTDTFVLESSASPGPDEQTPNFFMTELTSVNTVQVQASAAACPVALGLQVVELPGAMVTRGTTGPMSGTNLSVPLGTENALTTALLFSYRATVDAGSTPICDRTVEGTFTGTTIDFTRGCAGPATIDDISWELVSFGPLGTVQQVPIDVPGADQVDLFDIQPVDVTHSFVLSTSQALSGQGSSQMTSDGGTFIGDTLLSLGLVDGGTQIQVNRFHMGGEVSTQAEVITLPTDP
jgi:hypothetical protein